MFVLVHGLGARDGDARRVAKTVITLVAERQGDLAFGAPVLDSNVCLGPGGGHAVGTTWHLRRHSNPNGCSYILHTMPREMRLAISQFLAGRSIGQTDGATARGWRGLLRCGKPQLGPEEARDGADG